MANDRSVEALRNNLQTPARAYVWRMLIPNPIGGGDIEALRIRCESSVMPGDSHGIIHLDYMGTGGIDVPGRQRYSHTLVLVFREGEDSRVFDSIRAWRDKITDPKEGIGSPDPSVKTDIYLEALTLENNVWKTIKLIGVWPASVADVALTWNSDEVIKFSVTFQYDYWISVG